MLAQQVQMTMMAAHVANKQIVEPIKRKPNKNDPNSPAAGGGPGAPAPPSSQSNTSLASMDPSVKERSSNEEKEKDSSKMKRKDSSTSLTSTVTPNSSGGSRRLSFKLPSLKRSNSSNQDPFKALAELASKEDNFKYDLSQFQLVKQIGSGAFGKVQLCIHVKTGEKVVLKVVKKKYVLEAGQLEHIKHEVETMNTLSAHGCPFVVKTLGSFQDERNIYFVLEYVSGGELFSHLRSSKHNRFSEKRAKFYIGELVLALQYMHEQENVIYRDLKPENILLDEKGHIKVIDFGFAKQVDEHGMTYTFCGTPDYLAPEIISGKGYNKLADYWALGVFTYELTCGHAPFVTSDSFGNPVYDSILKGAYGFPKFLSQEAKTLIVGLLTVDPDRRLGSKNGMADIKNHPWFRDLSWNQLAKKQIRPPKPGKYKKGLVNIQGDAKPSVGGPENIDQSLFEEFDTVLKMEGNSVVAQTIRPQTLPPFSIGEEDENGSISDDGYELVTGTETDANGESTARLSVGSEATDGVKSPTQANMRYLCDETPERGGI
eukprot:comp21966_c0_seq1/m.31694 comp21966_c0_seq1/g.31694  ORF comp21966_c0_seq1/g.31694 comp21966_c0_seq1/m.31694 type:complete len:544 (-) comp21966_c0_seq1:330-1961(-)